MESDGVVSLVSEVARCSLAITLIKSLGARHDPAITARRVSDCHPLIIRIKIENQIFDRDHLKKPPAPGGVGALVFYRNQRAGLALHRRIEGF